MNKFCIIGNVTRDAELRATSSGVQVCSFSVAVNNPYRRNTQAQDGTQPQENTMFVRVNIWRDRGVALANYIKKGTKVYCEGPLQQPRIWKGNDGVEHADIQMNCDTFEFCSAKGDNSGYQAAPAAQQAAPVQQNNGFGVVESADDLPF